MSVRANDEQTACQARGRRRAETESQLAAERVTVRLTVVLGLVVVGGWSGLFSGIALAHELHLFVTAEGALLKGRASLGGVGAASSPVKNQRIEAFGPDSVSLGRTQTDDEGRFTFLAEVRCSHRFVLRTDDGHMAEYTVAEDLLPADLGGSRSSGPVGIEEAVERAVARQLRPLREEIQGLRARTQVRDIVGGVGFILGIVGILSLVASRRRVGEGPQ